MPTDKARPIRMLWAYLLLVSFMANYLLGSASVEYHWNVLIGVFACLLTTLFGLVMVSLLDDDTRRNSRAVPELQSELKETK